jgi:hypothetical protein
LQAFVDGEGSRIRGHRPAIELLVCHQGWTGVCNGKWRCGATVEKARSLKVRLEAQVTRTANRLGKK